MNSGYENVSNTRHERGQIRALCNTTKSFYRFPVYVKKNMGQVEPIEPIGSIFRLESEVSHQDR